MSDKIKPQHLDRKAVLYIRQSSAFQVAHNRESQALQYAIAKLHVAQAHRVSTGEQVLVAVIDSGIDMTHPEIAGTVAASFDAVAAQEGPDGHGTAMAGAIIAHAQLKGVAPAARLLAALEQRND